MTPTPPSPSDGSIIPPRHRPNLAEFTKNSVESDLWDLEEEDAGNGPQAEAPEETKANYVPAPRGKAEYKVRTSDDDAEPTEPAESVLPVLPMSSLIKISVNRTQTASQDPERLLPRPNLDLEIDDLVDWVDAPAAPAPAVVRPLPAAPAAPAEVVVEEAAAPAVQEEAPPVAAPEVAAPISLRPQLNLSPVERIGLIALLVLLLIGGVVLVFSSLGRLPTEAKRVEADSFPFKGQLVTILSADSFWREPSSDGPNAEIVRRGTALVPVLSLKISGGPAAVRIIFRDSDGKVVGDVVTRPVKAGSVLDIAATAGFDEVGMHAAYRTGQSKPWTVQLYEAASVSSPSQDFKKLFEMKISTARR